MDPVTFAGAGISIYQAGGLALLLLGMGVVGVSLMARWFMRQVHDLGYELKVMRDEMHRTLVGVIRENTKSNDDVRNEIARQTVIIAQQNAAMRDRPCLQETGVHKTIPSPLPRLMLMLCVLFALGGCYDARLPQGGGGHCGHACATLMALGGTIVWAGGIAFTLGILALVASLVWQVPGWLRGILAEAIALGFSAIVVGTSLVWLADHLWIIAVICGLVLVGLGYWYWPRISRFLANRKARKEVA